MPMNYAHLHLVLTHFPPVLAAGGALSAAVGIFCRRPELVRLAMVLLIAVGTLMPLVYIAGDRTADSIGRVEGVQQEAIAPHQRAAMISLAISICTALIAGALLIIERRRGSLSSMLRLVALAAAIAAALPIGWTAALGGAIHHPEISSLRREWPDQKGKAMARRVTPMRLKKENRRPAPASLLPRLVEPNGIEPSTS